jgi:CHASE3 domain sensor protein
VLQTVEVERQIAQVLILVQSGVGGYLLTGQDQYLTAYQAASSQLPTAQSRLSALVRDDPSQLSHLRQVTKLIERRLEIVAALVSSVQNNDPPRRRGLLLDRNKRTVDALNAQPDVMRAAELGRLADRREHARRARMGGTLAVVSDLGKGSTFWIELALAEAPDDHDWPQPKAAAPSA